MLQTNIVAPNAGPLLARVMRGGMIVIPSAVRRQTRIYGPSCVECCVYGDALVLRRRACLLCGRPATEFLGKFQQPVCRCCCRDAAVAAGRRGLA